MLVNFLIIHETG